MLLGQTGGSGALSFCLTCLMDHMPLCQSDRRGHTISLLRHANICSCPCQVICMFKRITVSNERDLSDFGKGTTMVAWRLTNIHTLSLIRQFSELPLKTELMLGHLFQRTGLCLSKARSVNKQNKHDDGWLLSPHLISANVQLFKVSCASLICFKAEEKITSGLLPVRNNNGVLLCCL